MCRRPSWQFGINISNKDTNDSRVGIQYNITTSCVIVFWSTYLQQSYHILMFQSTDSFSDRGDSIYLRLVLNTCTFCLVWLRPNRLAPQIHPSFRADFTLLIWVNMGYCAVSGNQDKQLGDWDMDRQGIDASFGWLTRGLTGRAQRSSGKWSIYRTSSPDRSLCLVLRWVNDFLCEAGRAELSQGCRNVVCVTVCRQSSRMCWQVLSVCLFLLLVGR